MSTIKETTEFLLVLAQSDRLSLDERLLALKLVTELTYGKI